ncbi:GtrA family protein [Thermomonas sp.]|uniref:GtrA family protein n=1 Tax=Thermomonas sp. TaxID=1971895 RepID=UPI0035B3C504
MAFIDTTSRLVSRVGTRLTARIRPSARFIRFLLVGGLNTAFGYGVFVGCLWLGMHYALAGAISTVLGVLFNFKSTGHLVFRSRGSGKLPHFVSVYAVMYVFGTACVGIFLHFGVPEWQSALILILPSAILSYLLNRRFVFRP